MNPDTTSRPRQRIESVDVVRGLIMILMALDHTRDYFGSSAVDPTNLATTTVALFFTRWVTHFCAPVFFLLTGTGAYLAGQRRGRSNLSYFLLTRGLWLALLELTVSRFFWQFNVDYHVTIITVLWALGWSMVVLSALVYLPTRVVGVIGGALILLHNLADRVQPTTFGAFAPLWKILHQPGVLYASPSHLVIVGYTLIPWVGVTAVGYSLGALYSMDTLRRRQILLRGGLAAIVAFLALRYLNIYGNPVPWAVQSSASFTVISFLNLNKYPPSLLFLLMTLGPAMLLLYALDERIPNLFKPALIIGKVPMFYYLLHVLVLHLMALVSAAARYGSIQSVFVSDRPDQFPITQPPGWPVSLPVVYLAWIMVVLLCYPCCRWYAALKARSSNPLFSYL